MIQPARARRPWILTGDWTDTFVCTGQLCSPYHIRDMLIIPSAVTRGGAHPWKVWGKLGEKKRKEEKGKGDEKRGEKEKERQGKMGNGEERKGNCKRGGGKLKMEGGRYENE